MTSPERVPLLHNEPLQRKKQPNAFLKLLGFGPKEKLGVLSGVFVLVFEKLINVAFWKNFPKVFAYSVCSFTRLMLLHLHSLLSSF